MRTYRVTIESSKVATIVVVIVHPLSREEGEKFAKQIKKGFSVSLFIFSLKGHNLANLMGEIRSNATFFSGKVICIFLSSNENLHLPI